MALSTIACNFDPNFNNGLPVAPDGHKTGINDLYINSSGNFVVLTGMAAVRQAIKQFMQLWLGEWFFNATVGMDYNNALSSAPDQAVLSLKTRIRELFQPFSGNTDQWQCNQNWNAYLSFYHSPEDYQIYQTKVQQITPNYDKYIGAISLDVILQFGNGQQEVINIQANANDIIVANQFNAKSKQKIDGINFIANQPSIQVQILFPDNYVIQAGELMVRLKVGGLYVNTEEIICSEYIKRLLVIPLQFECAADNIMTTDWQYISSKNEVKIINVY